MHYGGCCGNVDVDNLCVPADAVCATSCMNELTLGTGSRRADWCANPARGMDFIWRPLQQLTPRHGMSSPAPT